MFDLKLLNRLIDPRPRNFPSAIFSDDNLSYDSLARDVLILGAPSSGKTMWLAKHIVDYIKTYPDRPLISIDIKGELTIKIMEQILLEPPAIREELIKRLRYDALGHPDYVLPTPEFSPEYGFSMEDQVQRVTDNLARLDPDLMERAIMGKQPVMDTGPNVFRLLTAIKNEFGECWQITEAKRLIQDEALRKRAVTKFGGTVPDAKWFFEEFFDDLSASEKYRRTGSLVSVLEAVEPRETRAKLGYFKPAWTPKEAVERGLIVLVDGSGIRLHKRSREYLVMQIFSLVKSEIDKRIPGDPNDKPLSLVLDEGLPMLKIPSMAPVISEVPSQDRSKKFQLYMALQELNQVSKELRPSIWSFGNIVCFKMENFDDAYEIAKQLFPYVPTMAKMEARTDTQQPITEVYSGQWTILANKIQHLEHRSCLVRYYKNERDLDHNIHFVDETTEAPTGNVSVWDLKLRLLKEHGREVRAVLDEINRRGYKKEKEPPTL